MVGLAFQIPGGKYRRAEFFVCILPGMTQQFSVLPLYIGMNMSVYTTNITKSIHTANFS